MGFRTLDDLHLKGKRVLVRVDLNLPVEEGRVTDATRVERILPTIEEILDKGGLPILLAHFGRPKGRDDSQSLKIVAPALTRALRREVVFGADCVGPDAEAALRAARPGDVVLLENTRFHKEEEKNDPEFARRLAALGDLYVNDAFSAAHRAHASTEGIARLLPSAAGRAMQAELEALGKALSEPERPVVAVVGGAKVSTKLDLIGNLLDKVDVVVIGGGMANTFLSAQGHEVGKSLQEADMRDTAREIMAKAEAAGKIILLPVDVVAATGFKPNADHVTVPADQVPADRMILDAGPQSVARIAEAFDKAKTIVWNGPLGAFELTPFDAATNAAALKAADLAESGRALAVAGGGDTVAALNASGAAERFTYVSTAGGAFLEWLEGKTLPGVAALG
ncbi:phosphoglycerate kinase [Neomegalonema sp.]|uniref:phosphoglycerate kinase n=1 Tax=Neomegalonema sp. TaxID=2039713 RepID=UPI00262F5EE6|nr:phosphoglycerate kinase [Neomegalonema sp.]MDD2867082.1 phosphoglycerate kinase [Neomegalonema sp.]